MSGRFTGHPVGGKPLPVDAVARLSGKEHWNTIHWLVDTEQRLKEYVDLAKQKNTTLYIALEINVGLQRGGYDNPEKMAKAIQYIQANHAYVRCIGLMGYDGHGAFCTLLHQQEKTDFKGIRGCANKI